MNNINSLIKHTSIFLIIILSLSNCSSQDKPTEKNTKKNEVKERVVSRNAEKVNTDNILSPRKKQVSFDYDKIIQEELAPWLDYQIEKNAEFKLTEFTFKQSAPLSPQENSFNSSKDFWETYGNYLQQSPDNRLILDIYSNRVRLTQDETVKGKLLENSEVALIDKNTNTRQRLLFFDKNTYLDDAIWLDKETLLIVGGQDLLNSKYSSMIWYIDVNKQIYQSFVSHPLERSVPDYHEIKFESVDFEI